MSRKSRQPTKLTMMQLLEYEEKAKMKPPVSVPTEKPLKQIPEHPFYSNPDAYGQTEGMPRVFEPTESREPLPDHECKYCKTVHVGCCSKACVLKKNPNYPLPSTPAEPCFYCDHGDAPEFLGAGWYHVNGATIQAKCARRPQSHLREKGL